MSSDVGSVAEGERVVQGADHPAHVRQPQLQEADLDQDELVVLGQVGEA